MAPASPCRTPPPTSASGSQPSGQQKGCGFPVAKMLGVFCLATGGGLGHATSKWRSHDLSLWHRLCHLLLKNDVLVGDTGFCAYALMAELKARGVDTVFRLHQKRSKSMRRGKKLGQDDRLQTWNKPLQRPKHSPWKRSAWNKLPAQLEVRIVRVRIEKKGFRTRCLWLATTLSDAKSYPAELYYRRWSIELLISLRFTLRAAFGCLSHFVQLYRDVKTTMHLEAPR